MAQSKIVAIDLGAYDMRISAVLNRQPLLLPFKNWKQKCSSTVAVKQDTVIVGDSAINNPPDAIAFGACRANGPPTSDVWFNQPNNGVYTFPSRPDDRWYRQQIISELLKEAVTNASTYLKEKIDDVMITVPDHAGQHYRQLLLQAAEIAELNVVQLINQSTAAAAWYWTATKHISVHNVLFVNFGASNISAAVMVKSLDQIRPVSAAGDTTLGGEELTQQLMRYFLKKINNNKYQQQEQQEKHQQHINNKKFLKQLRQDCEKAINELSTSVEAHVEVIFFDDEIHSETLSRLQFESICHKQFDRVAQIVNAAITDFHKWAEENGKELRIHRVFLFGGSSQNAKIAEIVQQALGSNKEYYKMETSVIPDNAVAFGAAVLADLYDDPSKSKAIPNCVIQPFYCEVNGASDRIARVGDYLPITFGQHRLITSQSPASLVVLKANTTVVGSAKLPIGVSKSVIRLTANNLLQLRVASQQNEDYSIHVNFENIVPAGIALLDEKKIKTLRETSGRGVSDQQQCVRQLTQLVKFFMDKEPPLSASLAQSAEDLVQTIIDFLAGALKSVERHETSSEYQQLHDRIQSFVNYLGPLKQLHWGHISSTDVNGIASDIKDRLRVLKEKPVLQPVEQMMLGLAQAQELPESNSVLDGKRTSVQQPMNSRGAGQSHGDQKYNESSHVPAYSTSNAYQAATRSCSTVSVGDSTRTDQPLNPPSKTTSSSHQQNVAQKENLQAAQVQKLNLLALKNLAFKKLNKMRELRGDRITITVDWIKQLSTANEKVEQAATDSQVHDAFEQLKIGVYNMDPVFYSKLVSEGYFSLNELSSPNAATNQQAYSTNNAQQTSAPLGKYVHESGTKETYQTPDSPSQTPSSSHISNLTQNRELVAAPLQQLDLQTLKNRAFSKLSMMRDPNRFSQTSFWNKLLNTANNDVQLAATHSQVHDAFEQLKRNVDRKYRDLCSSLERDGYFSLNDSQLLNPAKNQLYQMPLRKRWTFWQYS